MYAQPASHTGMIVLFFIVFAKDYAHCSALIFMWSEVVLSERDKSGSISSMFSHI